MFEIEIPPLNSIEKKKLKKLLWVWGRIMAPTDKRLTPKFLKTGNLKTRKLEIPNVCKNLFGLQVRHCMLADGIVLLSLIITYYNFYYFE